MSRALVWFRRDLSLDDNLAWAGATSDHTEVLPVYILDHRLLDAAGPYRRRLLIASVDSLGAELNALGGLLTVGTGDPVAEVVRLARDHQVDTVVWNNDVTAFARSRDDATHRALSRLDIAVERMWSTLIHPPATILTAAGRVPRVFTRFYERWSDFPLPGQARAGNARVLSISGEALPPLDAPAPLPPGNAAAHGRLTAFAERVDPYDVDRDRPDRDATSHLSADLRFGTISPRAVLRRVGRSTPGRLAFVRQLAWRDWYAHLFAETPELVDHAQHAAYDSIAWNDNADALQAWKEGRTGFPIIDAGMRELDATGWMPNRLRLVTASFLVKDLLIDWRRGERHFRHLLIDADVPQNAGNWQWVASTGPDAAPYFRIMNPLTQARRFDPDGDYVRRWIPELAALRGADVHAPWELPPLELARAGITLGDTYPTPIIDHAAARTRTLAAYAAARDTAAHLLPN